MSQHVVILSNNLTVCNSYHFPQKLTAKQGLEVRYWNLECISVIKCFLSPGFVLQDTHTCTHACICEEREREKERQNKTMNQMLYKAYLFLWFYQPHILKLLLYINLFYFRDYNRVTPFLPFLFLLQIFHILFCSLSTPLPRLKLLFYTYMYVSYKGIPIYKVNLS